LNHSVIQRVATQKPDIEEDNLLPQWAVAMITIGFLSLVFVILFGVAVVSKFVSTKQISSCRRLHLFKKINKT
jgi:hypothetical protein